MSDDNQKHGSGTGELHPSSGHGEGRQTGSGIVDSSAGGGPGVRHDPRLGGGGPVGADVGGQGGTGSKGDALPGQGTERGDAGNDIAKPADDSSGPGGRD